MQNQKETYLQYAFCIIYNRYYGPEKTGLIYTKYTYSYYGAYLFFCICYPNSVDFIEFLRILCLYQEICVKMLCC